MTYGGEKSFFWMVFSDLLSRNTAYYFELCLEQSI